MRKGIFYYALFLALFLVNSGFSQEREANLDDLLSKGEAFAESGKKDSANFYFEKAEQIAIATARDTVLMDIYNAMGELHKDLREPLKALSYYQKGAIVAKDLGDPIRHTAFLGRMGICNVLLQRNDAAIRILNEALEAQIRHGLKEEQAATLDAIGGVYFHIEDYHNAEYFFNKAITTSKKYDFHGQLYHSYANLANVYFYFQENWHRALNLYRKSLNLSRQLGEQDRFRYYDAISTAFMKLQEIDSSRFYLDKAMAAARKNKGDYDLAKVYVTLGELHLEERKGDSALLALNKSLNYFKKTNIPVHPEYYKIRAKAHVMLEQYDRAYENILVSNELQKENLDYQSDGTINQFETLYKGKIQEAKIAALEKENEYHAALLAKEQRFKKMQWLFFGVIMTVILTAMLIYYMISNKNMMQKQENRRFRSIIEAEQKERFRIAQDLHDSLGQSISLIKLKTSNIIPIKEKKQQYDQLLEIVDNAYDELHDIAYNIMPDVLAQNGLGDAIKEISKKAENMSGVKISFEEPKENINVILNEAQRISLYRIVQETLSNIIKHADATHVSIKLRKKKNTLSLSIKDNGKGMDVSVLENTTGMGWKNIYSRVALIAGKIFVKSSKNRGTRVDVIIPQTNNELELLG